MPKRNMNEHDPLEDFDPREITLDGVTKVLASPIAARDEILSFFAHRLAS